MTILDMTLRDAGKLLACGTFVACVFWLPVIVVVARATP